MTDDASVAAVAKAIEAEGGLDVLVNNAGIEGRDASNDVIGAVDETAEHMQVRPVHFYPGVAYPASKTAVNTVTVQYAKAFPDMRINAVDPGYTEPTSMAAPVPRPPRKGAEIIVRIAQIGQDGPTGGYFDARGPVSW